MVLRTCGSDADKSRAPPDSMRWTTYTALTVRALARRCRSPASWSWAYRWWCYPGSSGSDGTLNLAFLIAAVAMIMRFAEPMAMSSATPRLWN